MIKLIYIYGLLSVGLLFSQPLQAQSLKVNRIEDLPADPATNDPQTGRPLGSTNRFTLFSLKEGRQIPNSDSATAKWDIGFRATALIVNGGSERTGKGGAFVYNGSFDALTAVPEGATFAGDENSTKLAIPTGSGNGWYTYGGGVILPTPDKVLLIRTADGKYAKIEILSYYRGGPDGSNSESRYYTFRYVYQPDGSKNLN